MLLRLLTKKLLLRTVEHREVYKKQTGGRGKFADILFEIGPRDDNEEGKEPKTGLQFVNEIVGGTIPREFIPPVQKGFEASMVNGALGRISFGFDESAFVPRFIPRCRFRCIIIRIGC